MCRVLEGGSVVGGGLVFFGILDVVVFGYRVWRLVKGRGFCVVGRCFCFLLVLIEFYLISSYVLVVCYGLVFGLVE